MKKLIFYGIALCAMMVSFMSCNGCGGTTEGTDSLAIAGQKKGEMVVERVVSTDREWMTLNYKGDYQWFETCILLNNFLDEEACDGSFSGLSNVFQVITNVTEKSADVHVILAAHTPDTVAYEVKNGFWIEDLPLKDEEIKLTYRDAYDRIQAVNFPKPHSKNCILRKPIGPKSVNPQYVFGNLRAQLWVDAVTGEVRDYNPAFPKELGFKMPLGEWP